MDAALRDGAQMRTRRRDTVLLPRRRRMLRPSLVRLYQPVKARDYPKPRTVITRTRSWRGLMQVRFNDNRSDHKFLLKQFLVWGPMRVFGSGTIVATLLYAYLGHDGFMYTVFGYESEAAVEQRPLGRPAFGVAQMMFLDRAGARPIRDVEEDREENAKFELYSKPSS